MKAVKYEKVKNIPETALTVKLYANKVNQKNPTYICVRYDRYLKGEATDPGYKIVNWQDINFVIPINN